MLDTPASRSAHLLVHDWVEGRSHFQHDVSVSFNAPYERSHDTPLDAGASAQVESDSWSDWTCSVLRKEHVRVVLQRRAIPRRAAGRGSRAGAGGGPGRAA